MLSLRFGAPFSLLAAWFLGATAASIDAAPPIIQVHPGSTEVVANDNTSLAVDFHSELTTTFQWRRNGVPITGETGQLIYFGSSDPSRSGSYDVVVTNADGSVTSRAANVTIATAGAAPVISSLSPDRLISLGSSFGMGFSADGQPFTSVKWYRDGALVSGTNSTGTSLEFSSASASHAGTYHAVVTNAYGSTTTGTLRITVGTAPSSGPPTITNGPLNLTTVHNGGTLQLSVRVSSATSTTYQWFRNNTAITDPTTDSDLVLEPMTASLAGTYHVVATNDEGSTTSAAVTVAMSPPQAPVLRYHPRSIVISRGDFLPTLNVEVRGSIPLSYQWYRNSVALPAATSDALALDSLPDPAGTYTVVVSNDVGSRQSDPAIVEVVEPFRGPPFITEPQDFTVYTGESVNLSGEASGSNIIYHWWKDGEEVRIGRYSSRLSFRASAETAGHYVLSAQNYTGRRESRTATVTVLSAEAPVITQRPADVTAEFGDTVTFTVAATGLPSPTFQWFHGNTLLEGATGTTLTLTNVQAADDGTYSVQATNSLSTVLAYCELILPVPPPQPPHITKPTITVPSNVSAPLGSELVLTAEVTGWPAPDLQWSKDGVALPGQTTSTLRIASFSASDAGVYALSALNVGGATWSSPITVAVADAFRNQSWRTATGASASAVLDFDDVGRANLLASDAAHDLLLLAENLSISATGTSEIDLSTAAPAPHSAYYQGRLQLTPTGSRLTLSCPDVGVTFELLPVAASASLVIDQIGPHLLATPRALLPPGHLFITRDGFAAAVLFDGVSTLSLQGDLATDGTFRLSSVGSELSGQFTGSTLSASLATAETTRAYATPAVAPGPERLVNLSTRIQLAAGQRVIVGLVGAGTGSVNVLLRAVGPGLRAYGITNPLADPHLQLYSSGYPSSANDNWNQDSNAAGLPQIATQVGAFPLAEGSLDAAMLFPLPTWPMSVHVTDQTGGGGVTLVEVYDRNLPNRNSARLTNLSTRGWVANSGEGVLVLGFAISGAQPKRVLIRGIGPALADFGISAPLAEPNLRLFQNQELIASNARWADSPYADEIAHVATQVGAFALPADSDDASLLVYLPPGAYTAQVSGTGDTTGEALVEVYEVP